MSDYKKQHYVPQTYLKAWEDENNKIYVYKKGKEKDILTKNLTVRSALYELDLYTKTIFDSVILDDEEKKSIFSFLDQYTVHYNDEGTEKVLNNYNDFTKYYFDFENWIILREDNTVVSKKSIKNNIEENRFTVIEQNWHCIENEWESLVQNIYDLIKNGTTLSLSDRDKLIEFMVVQKYRTLIALEFFKQMTKEILNFLKEYFDEAFLDKIAEEFGTAYFKQQMEKYQNGEKGMILDEIEYLKANANIVFFTAINKKFITSDNPVISINDKSFLKGKYNGMYFPILPNLMIGIFKGNGTQYSVTSLAPQNVRRFNNKIKYNCYEYYVTNYKK